MEKQLKKEKGRGSAIPYLLIIPSTIFILIFAFYPFIRSIVLSFTVADSMGNIGAWVGLYNFKKAFGSGEIWEVLGDTLAYALCTGVLTLAISLVLSYLCVKPTKLSNVYQTMYSMPLAISSVPLAAIFMYVFNRFGMLNSILAWFNATFGTSFAEDTMWLGDPVKRFIVLVIIVSWHNSGSKFVHLLVGFRNVSQDIVESSELDGANALVRFFRIYLPIASPQIFYVVFVTILGCFKSFVMVMVLVGANAEGLRTLAATIYRYGFSGVARFEMGCVYSIFLALVIFLVTRIQFAIEDKVVQYQ